MFLTGMVTIAIALDDGNGINTLWYDGTILKMAMVVYWVLICIIMAYIMGLRSHPGYLLLPTIPGTCMVVIDPLPPQGLAYCLMLLYLTGVVYLTIHERENYVPDR
jgi:hypothetical protein